MGCRVMKGCAPTMCMPRPAPLHDLYEDFTQASYLHGTIRMQEVQRLTSLYAPIAPPSNMAQYGFRVAGKMRKAAGVWT